MNTETMYSLVQNRILKRVGLPIALISIWLLICVDVRGDKEVVRGKSDDYIGTWTGFFAEGGGFCRLELKTKNQGAFAFCAPGDTPIVHRITEWRVDNFKLFISMVPFKSDDASIQITNTTPARATLSMNIQVKDAHGNWTRTATVYRENIYEYCNRSAKVAIAKAK